MPPLFEHLDYVERILALSPLGLMTDIDGTISFAAPNPAESKVSPICRNNLALLSKLFKLVAVISGRPIAQMRKMLGLEEIVYVGNHGFERWVGGKVELYNEAGQYPAFIEATLKELQPLLATGGIFFENKGITASIHYRLSHDHQTARRQIFAALANSIAARGLRIKPGRMAVDLLPPIEVNKGSAVRDLIKEYQLRSVIYLGDDITDLDAFGAIHEAKTTYFNGICLGVIDRETLAGVEEGADFTLEGVDEVERFLEWLVKAIRS